MSLNKLEFTLPMLSCMAVCLTASAFAAGVEEPSKNYLKRFSIEAPFTAIIEYVDDSYSKVEGQRIFKSDKPFSAGQGPLIALTGVSINLYGVSACPSNSPIQVFVYEGPCSGALPQYINTELSLSPIILCRAFMKYADEPVQDASCFSLFSVGDTSIVHNVEHALLKIGAGFLTRDKDGKALRPDLQDAENYAREKQTLLWNEGAKQAMGLAQ
jgi:hypothetical protein